MPKARDHHLNEQELQAVENAIRHDKRPEVRQRCTVIRLLHLGHKPIEVAKMQAVTAPTIYLWINRWRSGGMEGLANKPKSGRPLVVTDHGTIGRSMSCRRKGIGQAVNMEIICKKYTSHG